MSEETHEVKDEAPEDVRGHLTVKLYRNDIMLAYVDGFGYMTATNLRNSTWDASCLPPEVLVSVRAVMAGALRKIEDEMEDRHMLGRITTRKRD